MGRTPQTRVAAAQQGYAGLQPSQGGKGSFLVAWEVIESSRQSKVCLPQAWWEIGCGLLATAAWCGYMA